MYLQGVPKNYPGYKPAVKAGKKNTRKKYNFYKSLEMSLKNKSQKTYINQQYMTVHDLCWFFCCFFFLSAVYGKPLLPPSSTPPSPLPFTGAGSFPVLLGAAGDVVDCDLDLEGQMMGLPEEPPPNVDHIPRPLSPTKLTPMVHSPMRYQSDAELEVLRKKLANAPRPLKKRSSITEPEGPSGPNIQKLLYQRFNTLAGGIEGGVGGGGGVTPFYQPTGAAGEVLSDADNGNPPSETPTTLLAGTEGVASDALPQGDANDNQPMQPASETLAPPALEPSDDDDNNNNPAEPSATLPSPVPEASSPQEAATSPSSQSTVSISSTNADMLAHVSIGHFLLYGFLFCGS